MGDLSGRLQMLADAARALGPREPLTPDESAAEIARFRAWAEEEGWA